MATAENHASSLDGHHQKPDRRANASPQPTQSKRDKKRQLLTDRLANLTERFNRDRDLGYREQLQKIQIDTNLLMHVDPFTERPLEQFHDAENDLVMRSLGAGIEQQPRGAHSILELSGPVFQEWMHDVEDYVEERDYDLTRQMYEYEKKDREHKNTQSYKNGVAKREYKALCSTLRDRLINTIAAKKLRLTKEKEALEVSDASSLLLHPTQYHLNNPASPGGTHSKRATRLRHNAEEQSGYGDSRKRKRNGDDEGSPAPQRRALDSNGTTALWQNDRVAFRKASGTVYSIDKLFTDKELSMTNNQAAIAEHKHLLLNKMRLNGNGQTASTPSDSDSNDHDDVDDAGDTPAAAMMERVPSHATRSTRGLHAQNFLDDKLIGVEALANFEIPQNLERMIAAEPKMPPVFANSYLKGHSKIEPNCPSTLSTDDVNSDLMVMKVLNQYDTINGLGSNLDTANGARKVLEMASFSAPDARYAAYLQQERPDVDDLRRNLKLPASARDGPVTPGSAPSAPVIMAPGFGASPMSRQSSQGGVAMSRQSSNRRKPRN